MKLPLLQLTVLVLIPALIGDPLTAAAWTSSRSLTAGHELPTVFQAQAFSMAATPFRKIKPAQVLIGRLARFQLPLGFVPAPVFAGGPWVRLPGSIRWKGWQKPLQMSDANGRNSRHRSTSSYGNSSFRNKPSLFTRLRDRFQQTWEWMWTPEQRNWSTATFISGLITLTALAYNFSDYSSQYEWGNALVGKLTRTYQSWLADVIGITDRSTRQYWIFHGLGLPLIELVTVTLLWKARSTRPTRWHGAYYGFASVLFLPMFSRPVIDGLYMWWAGAPAQYLTSFGAFVALQLEQKVIMTDNVALLYLDGGSLYAVLLFTLSFCLLAYNLDFFVEMIGQNVVAGISLLQRWRTHVKKQRQQQQETALRIQQEQAAAETAKRDRLVREVAEKTEAEERNRIEAQKEADRRLQRKKADDLITQIATSLEGATLARETRDFDAAQSHLDLIQSLNQQLSGFRLTERQQSRRTGFLEKAKLEQSATLISKTNHRDPIRKAIAGPAPASPEDIERYRRDREARLAAERERRELEQFQIRALNEARAAERSGDYTTAMNWLDQAGAREGVTQLRRKIEIALAEIEKEQAQRLAEQRAQEEADLLAQKRRIQALVEQAEREVTAAQWEIALETVRELQGPEAEQLRTTAQSAIKAQDAWVRHLNEMAETQIQAKEFFDAQNWAQAADSFQTLLTMAGNDYPAFKLAAYYGLAMSLYKLDQPSEAFEAIDHARTIARQGDIPLVDQFNVLIDRATLLRNGKRYSAAVDQLMELERLIESWRADPASKDLIAQWETELRDERKALAIFYEPVAYDLALADYRQKRWSNALNLVVSHQSLTVAFLRFMIGFRQEQDLRRIDDRLQYTLEGLSKRLVTHMPAMIARTKVHDRSILRWAENLADVLTHSEKTLYRTLLSHPASAVEIAIWSNFLRLYMKEAESKYSTPDLKNRLHSIDQKLQAFNEFVIKSIFDPNLDSVSGGIIELGNAKHEISMTALRQILRALVPSILLGLGLHLLGWETVGTGLAALPLLIKPPALLKRSPKPFRWMNAAA